MSALTFILVVLVAFIAGVASVVDERQFHRPLVACTLMGFALGDPTTGIMLGGALELIALGWMNVGAAMAPDSALASTISAIVVIQGHQDITTGIAIAVPLAAAGQVLTIFVRTITVFFQHQADNFAKTANFRGIELMHLSGMALQGQRVAIPTAIVALISSEELTRLLGMIPEQVTIGLRIAGGMITVVGFAMVINMMRSKALMALLLPRLHCRCRYPGNPVDFDCWHRRREGPRRNPVRSGTVQPGCYRYCGRLPGSAVHPAEPTLP